MLRTLLLLSNSARLRQGRVTEVSPPYLGAALLAASDEKRPGTRCDLCSKNVISRLQEPNRSKPLQVLDDVKRTRPASLPLCLSVADPSAVLICPADAVDLLHHGGGARLFAAALRHCRCFLPPSRPISLALVTRGSHWPPSLLRAATTCSCFAASSSPRARSLLAPRSPPVRF
jgi:hypothetical protein